MQTVIISSTMSFIGTMVINSEKFTPKQPMIKKGNFVKAPLHTDSLTKNKEYLITRVLGDKYFVVKDDNNNVLHCKMFACGHLNGQDWILK